MRWFILILAIVSLTACNLQQSYMAFRKDFYTQLTQTSTTTAARKTPFPTQKQDAVQELSFASAPIQGFALHPTGMLTYHTQAGDTLYAVAARFDVQPQEIKSNQPLRTPGLLSPGVELIIPNRVQGEIYSSMLIPDSEVVNSPSSVGFNLPVYVQEADGYLAHQRTYVSSGMTNAANVVARVALETSINPRLLLALLEFECHCVLQEPQQALRDEYPLGFEERQGLYHHLVWAAEQLSRGYYGWRSGELTEIQLPDGSALRLAPELNAGSVALLMYFSQLSSILKEDRTKWEQRLDFQNGFLALQKRMFGNPWARAARVEPLFPPELTQPTLQLPIAEGTVWSYSGGPHWAWEKLGNWAAIDLAPQSTKTGCVPSLEWVTAAADGLVTRTERQVVTLDLDGDGFEQTGWVLLYVHVIIDGTTQVGDHLNAGDPIGHPTCEENPLLSSGTHVHFARKFNGEWMPARDSVKMVLDSWVVHAGSKPYEGSMTQGDQLCIANPFSPASSFVMRP